MNIYLILWTRYLLCLINILLTGLFALSFSSDTQLSLPFSLLNKSYLAPLLMVAIGMGIDLCKYLFWQYRHKSSLFFLMSFLLMLFSWAASVAFFLSQEQSNIIVTQKTTKTYQLHHAEMNQRQQTITEKRALLKKRLDSRYHSQWDKAAETMENINTLENRLAKLHSYSDTIGLEEAKQQLSTSAFFNSIANLFRVPASTITIIAYGTLALLIELCALGSISLAQSVSKTTIEPLPSNETNQTHNKKDNKTKSHPATRPINPDKKARLQHDILNGTIAPIIRQIKRSGYGLSEKNIRNILLELKSKGLVVDSGRHLRLTKTIKPK